jgi:hypothetical protein
MFFINNDDTALSFFSRLSFPAFLFERDPSPFAQKKKKKICSKKKNK